MARHRKHKKTVFVLGAGFSIPAGGPPQASLLERALALDDLDGDKVKECREGVLRFLFDAMGADEHTASAIALEDIYTPIDRCLADGTSFRSVSIQGLQEVRAQIEYLISVAINKAFDRSSRSPEYIRRFAKYLVELCSERAVRARGTNDATRAKQYDPVSVISLNWDILLDRYIHEELQLKDGPTAGDYDPIGVVDYCCYISSLKEHDPRVRSGLWALGARGYNVKLLKLHGSMNWLQCANCQRMFVSFNGKLNIPNFINSMDCRHCSRYGINAKLQGSLVMPTFLKDLTNFQIKLVWQNASVELMEATHVIFIGYSLPFADFEFRQLLARMMRRDVSVRAVLFDDRSEESSRRFGEEKSRYESFFSGRQLSVSSEGTVEFVQSLLPASGQT